jgi:hypothetical protein
MKRYINVIQNEESDKKLYVMIIESIDNINKWVAKQDSTKFSVSTLHEENAIDEEKNSLKKNITTVAELINNSKSDTDDPAEDIKDKNTINTSPAKLKSKILHLANSLNILHKVLISEGKCTTDTLNIIPIEKLMRLIQKAVIQNKYNVESYIGGNINFPYSRNPFLTDKRLPIQGGNGVSVYKWDDMGLRDNSWDSASIIARKAVNNHKSFPHHKF